MPSIDSRAGPRAGPASSRRRRRRRSGSPAGPGLQPVQGPERHHLGQIAGDPEDHEDVRRALVRARASVPSSCSSAFKPPHFEKYPQLHTLVNEATKLAGASGTKGELDAGKADELLAKIDEIAEIFWETKKA